MNLRKKLLINGYDTGLVKENISLDFSCPGRATIVAKSSTKLSGLVEFFYKDVSQTKYILFFTGYIEKSHTVDRLQQRLIIRELSNILSYKYEISIRNAKITDILGILARMTGLEFVVPEREYKNTFTPVFQTHASGIHTLDSLGRIFQINNYMWQQRADGKIFVGSWDDSSWKEKPLDVPETFFQDVQVDGTKTMQAIPGIRPGVFLNGELISSLNFSGHKMDVTCVDSIAEAI